MKELVKATEYLPYYAFYAGELAISIYGLVKIITVFAKQLHK
jgi:hypothetical protein